MKSLLRRIVSHAYVFIYSLNGVRHFGRQAIALGSLNAFKLTGILIVIAIAGVSVRSAAIGIVGGAAAALIVVAYLVRGYPKGGENLRTGMLLRTSLQFTALFFAGAIWDEIDILMFGVLVDSSDEVGLFRAGQTIAGASDALFLPLLLALFPMISSAGSSEANEEVASHVRNSIGLVIMIFIPLVASAFIVGDDVLTLFFGHQYVDVAFIVGPLTIAALFFILYEIVDSYLRASRRLRLSAIIVGGLLSLQIVLNFSLIPHYQIWGVVISILSVSILAGTGMVVYAFRALGLKIRWMPVARISITSVIAFLPLLLWEPDQSQYAVLLAAICTGVYAGLLIFLGKGKKSDIVRILGIARRLTHPV